MIEQRFLYLWFPQLATGRYIQTAASPEQRALWENTPFATTCSDHRGTYLCGLNPLARKQGLRAAMRLSDAQAMLPALLTQPSDLALDQRLLISLANIADHFSPWVALDGPHSENGEGGLWLDMSGAVHLFGGEENLCRDVAELFHPHITHLKTGLADSAWAAWAAARFHPKHGRLETGKTIAGSQAFPLEALNITTETVQRLNRLGLRTLADLCTLPRANLATRFGQGLLQRLDRFCGDLPAQLTYQQRPQHVELLKFYEEPLGSAEIIQERVQSLLNQLCQSLKENGLGIRILGLRFQRVDAQSFAFSINTSLAVHDPKSLMRLILPKLPGVDAGFGIETIHLRALKTQHIASEQQELATQPTTQVNLQATHSLMDRIKQRLGEKSVFYWSRFASFIPERSMTPSPTQISPQDMPRLPDRPIRLLPTPEHVNIQQTTPSGLPQHLTWRRQDVHIQHITGPERITREWWSKLTHSLWDSELGMRDYYRIQDQAGRDLWLCCSYGPNQTPRWFIHGWFG